MQTNSSTDLQTPTTQWNSNLCLYKLVQLNTASYKFVATGFSLTLLTGIISTCIFLSMFFIYQWLTGKLCTSEFLKIVPLLLFFALIFLKGLKVIKTPRIFDKNLNIYSGPNGKNLFSNKMIQETLSEITALQILSKSVSNTDGASYTTYELNLVFKGGRRLNVICHGNREIIYNDANRISKFLAVPVI